MGRKIMRKTPITPEEFEGEFWIYESRGFSHRPLCIVFEKLDIRKEFKVFWREVNIAREGFASYYFHPDKVGDEEKAMLRLMIAQEFIEQFNESLKE